jgi:hypothetical protein
MPRVILKMMPNGVHNPVLYAKRSKPKYGFFSCSICTHFMIWIAIPSPSLYWRARFTFWCAISCTIYALSHSLPPFSPFCYNCCRLLPFIPFIQTGQFAQCATFHGEEQERARECYARRAHRHRNKDILFLLTA